MGIRLIIEGNAVYEIDEDCLACGQENRDRISEDILQNKQENQGQNWYFSDCSS